MMIDNMDKEGLFRVLDSYYLDDKKFGKVLINLSQEIVGYIVNLLGKDKDEFLVDLLVELQEKYGDLNGGSIFYDYVPRSSKEVSKLMKYEKIQDLCMKNREEVLSLGEDFLPSDVFPINVKDEDFLVELKMRYPAYSNEKDYDRNYL